jgi:hypothetical protein
MVKTDVQLTLKHHLPRWYVDVYTPSHQTSHTPSRKVNPSVPSRSLLGANSSLATFHHHSGSTTSETSTMRPVAHKGGSLIEPPVDRYSFLPTRTPNLNTEVERTYGYIGVNTGLVLGLEEVLGVVEDVGKQLNERGEDAAMISNGGKGG